MGGSTPLSVKKFPLTFPNCWSVTRVFEPFPYCLHAAYITTRKQHEYRFLRSQCVSPCHARHFDKRAHANCWFESSGHKKTLQTWKPHLDQSGSSTHLLLVLLSNSNWVGESAHYLSVEFPPREILNVDSQQHPSRLEKHRTGASQRDNSDLLTQS